MWGLGGIERRTAREGYQFHDEETTADTAVVVGRIDGENHPFVRHFEFVKALEGEGNVAKQTIPAPIQTYSEVILDRADGQVESLRSVYATNEELAADIAAQAAATSSLTTARGASTATRTSSRRPASRPSTSRRCASWA